MIHNRNHTDGLGQSLNDYNINSFDHTARSVVPTARKPFLAVHARFLLWRQTYTSTEFKSTYIPENWLTVSEIYCKITVPHCILQWFPLYPNVHFYWPPLQSTVTNCAGHWPALFPTVRHCTILLTPTVPLCWALYEALTSTVHHRLPTVLIWRRYNQFNLSLKKKILFPFNVLYL